MHDHILVYSNSKDIWRPNLLPRSTKQVKNFKNPDNDIRGEWASGDYTCAKSKEERPNLFYAIINPNTGAKIWPKPTRVWAFDQNAHSRNVEQNLVWWGESGKNAVPRIKKFPDNVRQGTVPVTVWLHNEVGNNQDAKREVTVFNNYAPFATPKPERLIERIFHIATHPGDLILDSFLGSGTTAAVAHKMGRRYIGIELGDHAVTHCVPRLKKVIEGEPGGISKSVGWQGGGGFRFYRLGPPVFDASGALHPGIRFPTLGAHVWFTETKTPWTGRADSPLLGVHEGTAYYLLFNGILGDRRPEGGNVLNEPVFRQLPPHNGPKVIYGEWSQWRPERLAREEITFKQIPYDVRVR